MGKAPMFPCEGYMEALREPILAEPSGRAKRLVKLRTVAIDLAVLSTILMVALRVSAPSFETSLRTWACRSSTGKAAGGLLHGETRNVRIERRLPDRKQLNSSEICESITLPGF